MASYKVLKSVAHNLGHSVVSLMNYQHGDYAMGHLLRRARLEGLERLDVDLLAGTASPPRLCVGPVHDAVVAYFRDFPSMVATEGTDISVVAEARMSIEFDLTRDRPVEAYPWLRENPYLCRVQILDDRGKRWEAEHRGWWFPEPDHALSRDTQPDNSDRG